MSGLDENPEWHKIKHDERTALDSMLEREEREFRFVRWLDGGYSGSPVAVIQDKLKGRSSKNRILKLCSKGYSEAQGISAAYELAPDEFKRQHLVKKLRDFPLHEWWGVLMEVAGGDLSSPSLADYATDERLSEICAILIGSLLADWNKGDRELADDLGTGRFLQRVVGPNKIETGGSLSDFVRRSKMGWDDPWISRIGWDGWLKNPLRMLSDDFGSELNAVVGIGHGDLSVFNVLIPGFPDLQPAGYWLIDYGASGPSHPLTRDPMYLLLSIATRWLQDMPLSSTLPRFLIKVLAASSESVMPINIAPYQKVRREVIKAGYDWAKLTGRGEDWIRQSQLSLIGCALTFIGRKIGSLEISETDNWLFDLATVAATEYCKTYEREESAPPPGPPSPRPPVDDQPTGDGLVSELFEELGSVSFSQEHWTQLELGTRDLRAMLRKNYEIDSDSSTSILGFIAELRRVLDSAVIPLATQDQLSHACRRAEDLRERLMTLLRP